MADSILYRHVDTGQERLVARGWSWSLFLLSGLFGIPLFLRGLYGWGVIMAVIALFGLYAISHPAGELALRMQQLVAVVFAMMSLWLGLQGNSITAEHLEAQGWETTDDISAA